MMNFLESILTKKREEVAARKKDMPEERLKNRKFFSAPVRSLARALSGTPLAVIAEIKKASPSKGIIRENFDHREISRQLVDGGASALSILSDEYFFSGHRTFLENIRNIVHLPLLRKDFIIDPYQLCESKAYGADAVLLIAAALDAPLLSELYHQAETLGLESVVEVHSESDLQALEGLNVKICGINNRDLATFRVDLETTARLRNLVPPGALVVSESGINTASDLKRLSRLSIHGALIGESLMHAADPGKALETLLHKFRNGTS